MKERLLDSLSIWLLPFSMLPWYYNHNCVETFITLYYNLSCKSASFPPPGGQKQVIFSFILRRYFIKYLPKTQSPISTK